MKIDVTKLSKVKRHFAREREKLTCADDAWLLEGLPSEENRSAFEKMINVRLIRSYRDKNKEDLRTQLCRTGNTIERLLHEDTTEG